ncbi:MAG TPA: hypothetical protein DEV93_01255 [Chloroflexi bacterium]|jgi:hypothetical protein|nr:hypothetical protein [Chloroflexota bacterium]
MEDGRVLGAQDLILAVFRLAVADYLGTWYGHDEPAPAKRTNGRFRADAEKFLRGAWAAYLGDLVGLESAAVWRWTHRLMCTGGYFPPLDCVLIGKANRCKAA